MLPSGSGVGLADGWDFAAGLWPGEGEATGGIVGRAAGVGNGARVGRGAGVPIGAIVGIAPGVGNLDSELSWPFAKTTRAKNVPAATNSFFSVGM